MTKSRQSAGFLQEAFQSTSVVPPCRSGSRDNRAVGLAYCQIARQELLNRHIPIKSLIMRQIGDAEAARANHARDAVVAVENGVGWQSKATRGATSPATRAQSARRAGGCARSGTSDGPNRLLGVEL